MECGLPTEAFFWSLARSLTGKPAMTNDECLKHFGCLPSTCHRAWALLVMLGLVPSEGEPKHLLWCLLHIMQPGSVTWVVLSSIVSEEDGNDFKRFALQILDALELAVEGEVLWGNRLTRPRQGIRNISFEGLGLSNASINVMSWRLDFRVPRRAEKHGDCISKNDGECYVSYQVCAAPDGDIVSISPSFTGAMSNEYIFASQVIPQLEREEIVLVPQPLNLDQVAHGHYWKGKAIALDHCKNDPSFVSHFKSLKEDVSKSFMRWGCLSGPSNCRGCEGPSVDEMHEKMVKVVALLIQLEKKEDWDITAEGNQACVCL